jgi:alpha-glucoside transport system permease protein
MQRTSVDPRGGASRTDGVSPARLGVGALALLGALGVIWGGFVLLRQISEGATPAPQLAVALFAILWGVGGVALVFTSANLFVEALPERARGAIQPYVFVGPAVLMLAWFLLIPTLRTFYVSFFNQNSSQFVGLDNYIAVFTERTMLEAFRNNLLWMVIGTTGCVVFGLLIAVLADRSKFETLAKALIFLPMAISFVGAGIIWRFIYAYAPPGQPQIGLLNAVVVALGGTPQAWIQLVQPWNNLFLIITMIWLQTGFAMVVFSSAIKGIPEDIIEASRVDGATELQIFWRIMLPAIQGTLITVTTTIVIFTLKIFDIVMVMTGGQYGTHVIATQFYRQFFTNRNFGYGSAIAIVLLFAVIPVMIYNLREFNKQETFR